MASIKETAKQEYNLYAELGSVLGGKNKPLLEDAIVKEVFQKIVKNKDELSNFIQNCDKLSEKEQQEKWIELKANSKIVVSKEHQQTMKNFFQKVDSSVAKTEAYKNIYKIYLENMVSENGQKTNDWKKEKEQLTERKNAVMQAKEKYAEYGFDSEYKEKKDAVQYVTELMEAERHKYAPEYLKLQEEYENKYKEKGGVLIEDQEYLKELWESLSKRKASFEKSLENNVELDESQRTRIQKEIERIEEKQQGILEMSADARNLQDARERADSSPNMKKLKAHYKDAMERLAPLEKIKKEDEAVKEASEKLEKKMQEDVIINSITDKANILSGLSDMHEGSHTNSKSYQKMIAALDIVREWNDKDAPKTWQTYENAPATLNDALKLLQKASQEYLDEKNAQFRPFPSALRQSRLGLAEAINEFAKGGLEDLKLPANELVVEKVQQKQQEVSQRDSVKDSINAFSINSVR